MNLVFMVEELSMKVFLEGFLPRVLPDGLYYRILAHEGKSDLQKSIPRKLRAWQAPDAKFIILHDQDASDCRQLKEKLVKLCREGGRPDAVVRVVCRELESWFVGDFPAVAQAFGQPKLSDLGAKSKYRNPDALQSPARELGALIRGYGKVGAARSLGEVLEPERCRSHSFSVFLQSIQVAAASEANGFEDAGGATSEPGTVPGADEGTQDQLELKLAEKEGSTESPTS